MLGLGVFEILIIALVCLIALGPTQLPVVMRKAAGFYRQFLTLKDELRFQVLSADSPNGKEVKKNNLEKSPATNIQDEDKREMHG